MKMAYVPCVLRKILIKKRSIFDHKWSKRKIFDFFLFIRSDCRGIYPPDWKFGLGETDRFPSLLTYTISKIFFLKWDSCYSSRIKIQINSDDYT